MKILCAMAVLAGVLLSGCMSPQPNPEFSRCANACATQQDTCMVNASTAGEIEQCDTRMEACMAQCKKAHSRYL